MDFLPSASLESLRLRARLMSATRRFFEEQGYWEVDTPHLSRDTCIDAWIEPVVLEQGVGGDGTPLVLQTSPEFAMKRLLAAGADAIYQLGHVFRQGERGPRHNPEFTMLEWYRLGDTYHQQMTFTEAFVRQIAAVDLGPDVPPVSLPAEIPRITYDDAFERATGSKVLQSGTPELRDLARRLEIRAPESLDETDRDGWLNLILAERVEPWLASQGAVFLCDYPASQCALANVRRDFPSVSERFELYVGAVELCNGYQELTDARELVRRMSHQNALRRQCGLREFSPKSRLTDAMKHGLPMCFRRGPRI